MKKYMTLVTVVAMFSLVLASVALAQGGMKWKGGGGWGPGTSYARMYNPQTVQTTTGEVVMVNKIAPAKGMSYGVHLLLKTDKETISVHLGPEWYLENQDVKIAPKDSIEVKGSLITFNGKPALIAAEIRKGDEVLTLRNVDGFPVWSGWRRR